jgi:hypothetical protein
MDALKTSRLSAYAALIVALLLCVFRLSHVDERELSWDVLGYYLPLPATIVHDDPLLKDISWLKETNDRYQLTGTLYQISQNEKGETMYFFLFGMSYVYLPSFLVGHAVAHTFGYEANGFSEPYIWSLVIGGLIFTLIGLYYLRKFLLVYLSDRATALAILILFLATNASHHLSLKNLETVNFLFTLAAFTLYKTTIWLKNPSFKTLLPIGLAITLITLIKPSEIIITLIPLFWLVDSWSSLKNRIQFLWKQRIAILLTLGICLIILSPQLIYWFHMTGKLIYDSYKNPGIGLDLTSPHILPMLLSYRKGWLVYTPIMILAIGGMYFLWKRKKELFIPIAVYGGLSVYIVSSWTEWWYGASFSIRPLIILYPLLAIPMIYFIKDFGNHRKWITSSLFIVIIAFAALNQFQWWQLRNWIIDPYRTTGDYYHATFLSTSVPENSDKIKLINRDFSGINILEDRSNYTEKILVNRPFDGEPDFIVTEGETKFYRINSEFEYCLGQKIPVKNFLSRDHAWIEFSFDYKISEGNCEQQPALAMALERKEGSYGYMNYSLPKDSTKTWQKFKAAYLTPSIRNSNDVFNYYIWNPGKCFIDIDNLKISVMEPIKSYDPEELIIF